MPARKPPPSHQRMFNGSITASALADQLCARFSDRQHRTSVQRNPGSALVQIGSPHGTPLTVHLADISGGVLVSMSRGRDWLDQAGDAGQWMERASQNPFSLLTMLPDVLGELGSDNLPRQVWDAINDLMALSRSLAGEKDAPANPKLCPFCHTANDPELERCVACGAPLPLELPRICPKCSRQHSSDALFCQACGARLVEG